MLSHYLRRSWVSALRHKQYTALNLVGLAVGMASFLLIALFVRHELSYDRFPGAERLYRLGLHISSPEGTLYSAKLPAGFAPLIQARAPGIAQIVRFYKAPEPTLRMSVADRHVSQENVLFADPAGVRLFEFPILRGSAARFEGPGAAMLTATTAARYFGSADPIGRTITLDGKADLEVIAVIDDRNDQTHFDFQMLLSLGALAHVLGPDALENTTDHRSYTYLQIDDPARVPGIEKSIDALLMRFAEPGETYAAHVMRVRDIHVHSPDPSDEMKYGASAGRLYTLLLVGVLIIVISCVNFMNLATARAAQSAKEIAVRKVVGASRGDLIVLFLIDALLLALLATILACAIVELVLPAYSAFVDRRLPTNLLSDPQVVLFLLAAALAVGLFSGSYPAFYLSDFRPMDVFRKQYSAGPRDLTLRNALVVLQFGISIALIIVTVVIFAQMRHADSLHSHFNRERIVLLDLPAQALPRYEALRDALRASPAIEQVVTSSRVPTQQMGDMLPFRAVGDAAPKSQYVVYVEPGFLELYGVELLAGEPFAADRLADRVQLPDAEHPVTDAAVIINESFTRELGLSPGEAIGQTIDVPLAAGPLPAVRCTIIAVTADVNFASARDRTPATAFMVYPRRFAKMSVRIAPGRTQAALRHIDATWNELFPDTPVHRSFLGAQYDLLYVDERLQAIMLSMFTLLAIGISCMGLYGLAAFATERRTKEIAIRSVLGASRWSIVKLFAWEFSVLVIIANVIAWPLTYVFARRWLDGFVQRIDLSLAYFVLAGAAAMLVAWLTVSMQAWRATAAPPVESLRYE